MFTHTYIHTYIHTYVRTDGRTYIHTYIYILTIVVKSLHRRKGGQKWISVQINLILKRVGELSRQRLGSWEFNDTYRTLI